MFVESYGRSAHENPLYAPTVTATLGDAEARLAAAGLAARSALAHLAGGRRPELAGARHACSRASRIDNEGRYRALLASPRRTLLHLAQAAGWRTAAVMPAITLPWPEAAWFGYDTVLAAHGPRLPRPAVQLGDDARPVHPRRPRAPPARRRARAPPVFAEVALISSHAPWTPIPPLLPWDALGDGAVFDAYAAAGDPPEVVWRDPDRVRDQYRLALDYALRRRHGLRRAPRRRRGRSSSSSATTSRRPSSPATPTAATCRCT